MSGTLTPQQLIETIPDANEAGTILYHLATCWPNRVNRIDLMHVADIIVSERGPICAYAAFHWHLERAKDFIRGTGWKIEGGPATREIYMLAPVAKP